MNLDKGIKGRRAVRKYKERDIPDSVIAELLDLARHAPSSMNGQPGHFIVVKNESGGNTGTALTAYGQRAGQHARQDPINPGREGIVCFEFPCALAGESRR